MQEPPSIPYLEPIAARRSAGLTWLPRAIATVYILVVVQALADGFQSRRRRVRFGSLHSGTLPDMGLQGRRCRSRRRLHRGLASGGCVRAPALVMT